MLVATVGQQIAGELGLGSALADETPATLSFGSLEPLVCLMQETPVNKLLPALTAQLESGTELRGLIAAAALANARTFGGEDYVGFHTMMALAPALHMSRELPAASQALPVFKVLYRNTNRIQERGGRRDEVLRSVKPAALPETPVDGAVLREAVRSKRMDLADQTFAAMANRSTDDALPRLGSPGSDRDGSGPDVVAAVRPLLCEGGVVAAQRKVRRTADTASEDARGIQTPRPSARRQESRGRVD
jgi:hypothetical protein